MTGDAITPIFMAHPHYDNIIHCSETARANDAFRKMGWDDDFDWKDYPDDKGDDQQRKHWICEPQGVEDLCEWLMNNLRNCSRRRHPPVGHLLSFFRLQTMSGEVTPEFAADVTTWLKDRY